MASKDKKQAILDTALQLFVKQGFYATSTASIAKQAGVATGTLFHHFSSKEVLINHLFLSVKQELADAIKMSISPSGDLRNDAQSLWLNAVQWAMDNPDKQLFFEQSCISPLIGNEIKEQAMNNILGFMAELLLKAQEQGLLAYYPLDIVQAHHHSQFLGLTRFFIDNPDKWQDKEYRKSGFSMLWNALIIE